jgi:hypothetical protein
MWCCVLCRPMEFDLFCSCIPRCNFPSNLYLQNVWRMIQVIHSLWSTFKINYNQNNVLNNNTRFSRNTWHISKGNFWTYRLAELPCLVQYNSWHPGIHFVMEHWSVHDHIIVVKLFFHLILLQVFNENSTGSLIFVMHHLETLFFYGCHSLKTKVLLIEPTKRTCGFTKLEPWPMQPDWAQPLCAGCSYSTSFHDLEMRTGYQLQYMTLISV